MIWESPKDFNEIASPLIHGPPKIRKCVHPKGMLYTQAAWQLASTMSSSLLSEPGEHCHLKYTPGNNIQ